MLHFLLLQYITNFLKLRAQVTWFSIASDSKRAAIPIVCVHKEIETVFIPLNRTMSACRSFSVMLSRI